MYGLSRLVGATRCLEATSDVFNTAVAMLTSQQLTAFPNHSQFFKRLFSATKANAKNVLNADQEM
jgi:hypothetical protein